MTLVAACRVNGVPAMIGDFLITGPAGRFRGYKKIARLRPTLAVGWTGRRLQAEMTLAAMYAGLGDHPSRSDLQGFLESFDVGALGQPRLKLVGWVADDDGIHGFHWDASAPSVSWGDPWFVGTGSAWMENIYDRYMSVDADAAPHEDAALGTIVGALAELNIFDAQSDATHRLGFGGGYEALYWAADEASFRYVEHVLCFPMTCSVDASGSMSGSPIVALDDMTHYQTIGECAVLTLSKPVEGAAYTMWAMTPLGVPFSEDALRDGMSAASDGKMNMAADYYAAGVTVVGPHAIAPMSTIVQCPGDAVTIRGASGRLDVAVPPEAIELMFRERAVPFASVPAVLKPLGELLGRG